MIPAITQERLAEVLSYSPETGLFTRKVDSSNGRWKASSVAGSMRKNGYVIISIDGAFYLAHRLAWLAVYGVMPEFQIDHINGVPSDNRLRNLREATNAQNNQNKRRPQVNNTSGYLGVTFDKQHMRWRAQVKINGRKIYCGLFDTAESAYLMGYLPVKRKVHGYSTL